MLGDFLTTSFGHPAPDQRVCPAANVCHECVQQASRAFSQKSKYQKMFFFENRNSFFASEEVRTSHVVYSDTNIGEHKSSGEIHTTTTLQRVKRIYEGKKSLLECNS
jgi:hypothetical protein